MGSSKTLLQLKGVGGAAAEKLTKLGIKSVDDLIVHYPRRYDDYSSITPIAKAAPGKVTVKGVIARVSSRPTGRGRNLTTALIEDDTGSLQAVWFNQPYLSKSLPKNIPVYCSGELKFAYNNYALQSPTVEPVSVFPKNAARIVPIYPETEGVSSKQIRRLLAQLLPIKVDDPLPASIRTDYRLMDKSEALTQIHFPDSNEKLMAARHRLAFEELYVLLLALNQAKTQNRDLSAPVITFNKANIKAMVAGLPFKLTSSQRLAAWRIIKDMQRSYPMNRLLQGDVGSGKTVVAAVAAATVASNQLQTAMLVPTEVLAEQHYATLCGLLEPLKFKVALLTGNTKAKDRSEILKRLDSGDIDVCVGTHALLKGTVKWHKLGLVVVDEQHRFGVEQRRQLIKNSAQSPHFLSMSATPIPRSLALTIYGDLDISVLNEVPPGRKPVITRVMVNARTAYSHLKKIINAGGQVFVVCPLIEESDTLGVTSVEKEIHSLKQHLPGFTVTGLHGRMKANEKKTTMAKFKAGKIDILVSTTVIEVGLDVANATAIVVEGAERFGLATLHQLRGRVGRGSEQAYCYLKPSTPQFARQRLELLEHHHDGQLLAEKDLELRGAGQLYGNRQHGALDFRLVKLTDVELIATVKKAVSETGTIKPRSLLGRLVSERQRERHLN